MNIIPNVRPGNNQASFNTTLSTKYKCTMELQLKPEKRSEHIYFKYVYGKQLISHHIENNNSLQKWVVLHFLSLLYSSSYNFCLPYRSKLSFFPTLEKELRRSIQ
jgi:hypothetical protein